MSGTGRPSPSEQHLGDRLAALVDGELGHDARERVLAHLATCGKCKAEADAQRRLKSVFAETAPPGPSEGLLARLQGLPGGDQNGPGSRLGAGGLGPGDFATGGPFGYLPSEGHAMSAVPPRPRQQGFRVHDTERPAPQRRRFAFAAAGAVSLAAFALGGALPLEAAVDTPAGRGEGTGTAVPLSATPPAGGSPVARRGAPPQPQCPVRLLTTGRSAGHGSRPQLAGALRSRARPCPPALSMAPSPTAGRFGLPPLIAATGPGSAYHLAPVAAESQATAKRPQPQPPLEPKRPLVGSAASPGPAAQGTTPAQH